jgi:hypothetical protein
MRRSPQPEIGFEFRPELDTYNKLVSLRTNSAGFRDAEYTVEKPAEWIGLFLAERRLLPP